jgi:MYXO-CTERM domain-containing protein
VLVQQDGGTAVLRPPTVLCAEQGGKFPFELLVKDDSGLSSLAGFDVPVAPWGTPNVAFGAVVDGGMVAGTTRVFTPTQPLHACVGTSGFPGVETLWTVDGGVPAGVTLRAADTGALVSTFPVRAPGLIVETQDCINDEWVLSAVNRTLDGGSSAPSLLPVRVQTVLAPLATSKPQLSYQRLSEDKLRVEVSTESGLNCLELRPGLKAELSLGSVNAGGGVTPLATVGVDLSNGKGQWSDFSLGVGCKGGHFRVTGSLVDGAGVRSARETKDVETPQLRVELQALSGAPTLTASCEGARATLTQTFPEQACQAPDVTTWEQVSGPELTQARLDGRTVSLATRETRLESLVGQSVVMKVTSSVSSVNEASIEHSLPITVEPFVRVRRRAEVPAASDTELVGVSVELINTLACGVGSVDYVERMRGLTYVAGSAQFNGVPVEASWEDGALSVKGLSLGGADTGRLTYVARPHLLGERRMEGEARLNGAVISISRQPGIGVPDTGCGCTSSGPGPVLFALGALVAAVRRRRR